MSYNPRDYPMPMTKTQRRARILNAVVTLSAFVLAVLLVVAMWIAFLKLVVHFVPAAAEAPPAAAEPAPDDNSYRTIEAHVTDTRALVEVLRKQSNRKAAHDTKLFQQLANYVDSLERRIIKLNDAYTEVLNRHEARNVQLIEDVDILRGQILSLREQLENHKHDEHTPTGEVGGDPGPNPRDGCR